MDDTYLSELDGSSKFLLSHTTKWCSIKTACRGRSTLALSIPQAGHEAFKYWHEAFKYSRDIFESN